MQASIGLESWLKPLVDLTLQHNNTTIEPYMVMQLTPILRYCYLAI